MSVGNSLGTRQRSSPRGKEARSKDVDAESPSHSKVLPKVDAVNPEETVSAKACASYVALRNANT